MAKVATLGWNPSKLEFLDDKGHELTGAARRLETLTSLGIADLASATRYAVRRVFEACNAYFQRCPYRKWFDVLEKVLRPLGASYYDGSACHLDLVQWATDPTWRKLQRSQKESLLQADLPFLCQQLSHEHLSLLLLNGSGIAKACRKWLNLNITEIIFADKPSLKCFVARMPNGLKVIGWNKNLQSSFGVSNDYKCAVSRMVEQHR